jgi:hypothetical protein
LFTPRSSVIKKTLIAAEQDRPDVARRRAQWTQYRERIDPSRLVFIDEHWTKTNMTPQRGLGAARPAHQSQGATSMTFLTALRHDRTPAFSSAARFERNRHGRRSRSLPRDPFSHPVRMSVRR